MRTVRVGWRLIDLIDARINTDVLIVVNTESGALTFTAVSLCIIQCLV
jgi:hypothetical protein